MTDLLRMLGVPGVLLIVAWLAFVGYWAGRVFRPEATWSGDLARWCARCRHRTSRTRPRRELVMGHVWWPRAEVGPRMWRWPLNSTRYISAVLWRFLSRRRGLLALIARLAWYPATGIGAAAALTQAVILVATISVPVGFVAWVIDSTTVIRGGYPPARRSHARKAQATYARRNAEAQHRLTVIRHHHERAAA